MTTLPARLRDHVARKRLLPEPGTAVVAVSGGADSVALLDLVHALAPELGLSLVVAHADHGMRADSRTVALAVRELVARYGLPFELAELGLGPGASETVARQARYRWLEAVRQRHAARYVLTAHHRDDQVETILLRMLRGSAPGGLAGIPARGRGGLVRPLLPFTRAELAAHVTSRGLAVHDDPANHDPKHVRSWIRTVLLPSLETRLGPRLRDELLRAGRAAALERRAWDRALEHLLDLQLSVHSGGFEVAREGLGGYDARLAVAALRAAARRVGLVLGMRRARALIRLAGRPSGRRLALGGGWEAEVAFDRIRVRDRTREVMEVGEAREVVEVVEVASGTERGGTDFGAFRLTWSTEPAPERIARGAWSTWFVGGDWEVRAPRPGDRLIPLGATGHREVRRLLMEARVPRSDRGEYPIVARGETILWIPGVCRSAAALPRPGTRAVRVDVTEHGEP